MGFEKDPATGVEFAGQTPVELDDAYAEMYESAPAQDFLPDHQVSRGSGQANNRLPQFFNQIRDKPVLTKQEVKDLYGKYRSGSEEESMKAYNRLTECNLKLVVSIAKEYEGVGPELEELIAGGTVGLVKAIQKFEPERDLKFSTLGTFWIRQSIQWTVRKHQRGQGIPNIVCDNLYKVISVERELERRNQGLEPGIDELAAETGLSAKEVGEVLMMRRTAASTDKSVGEEGDTTLGELIRDEEAADPSEIVHQEQRNQNLKAALSSLSDRERMALEMHYGLNDDAEAEEMTLREVSRQLGVSLEWTRQIIKKALGKLEVQPDLREQLLEEPAS